MKCLVCGETVKGDKCPFCAFPVYEIISDDIDDIEASAAQIRKKAKEHRSACLRDLHAGIVLRWWKEENGEVVLREQKDVMFADGPALEQGEVWLSQPLARLAEQKTYEVEVVLSHGSGRKSYTVSLPNLPEEELQMIGFRLQEPLHLCLLLKNDSNCASSEPLALSTHINLHP